MSTIVFFHAHPDDEVITTGGSIARAAAEGHRVVLVVATNGDLGEVPDDLADDESIVDRRRVETERSAAELGVHHIEWLGYRDSGMTGWPDNGDPRSFLLTPIDESAELLGRVLRAERADIVVVYDWHGGYGHPDHVQVHRVGHRAAELAGTSTVFEATFNRDVMIEAFRSGSLDFDPEEATDDGNPVGTPASQLNLEVDVTAFVGQKRRALACHASQTTDVGGMMSIPEEIFSVAFGTEWFIRSGTEPGLHSGWLFD